MKALIAGSNGMASVVPARGGGVRDWQRWAPYAAVAWSLFYATLGVFWAVSGRGFPYAPETVSNVIGPVVARFGPGVAWNVVVTVGIPAVVIGTAMLRGVRSRALRPLFITAGALLAGVLLLLMTDLTLLTTLGYIPFVVFRLLTGAEIGFYLQELAQWTVVHQLLCLIGGVLWLGATFRFTPRGGGGGLALPGRRGWLRPWAWRQAWA